MAEYLNIGREEQAKLIRDLKDGCSLSWTNLAKELSVTRGMMFFYLRGEARIPKDKLEILLLLSNYPADKSKLRFVEADFTPKEPIFPPMSADLAEFLGILYGDGCLVSHNYGIDISGDKVSDFSYHQTRVSPLFSKLFGISARFQYQENCIHTRLYSKKLHEFLSSEFSFPIGEKKGRMRVPEQIYRDAEYKRAFLRGLFDTDGGINYHHFKSSQLQYTCHDPLFLKEIFDLFKSLDFNIRFAKDEVKMFDRKEISRFFNEIRPANPKHVYKYQEFLKTGWVPRHRDIDYEKVNAGGGNRTHSPNLEGSDTEPLYYARSIN